MKTKNFKTCSEKVLRSTALGNRGNANKKAKTTAWEAADVAAAIAESRRLALGRTHAQRREADAGAELKHLLRESAAEANRKKARDKSELARLHESFRSASSSRPQQGSSSTSKD